MMPEQVRKVDVEDQNVDAQALQCGRHQQNHQMISPGAGRRSRCHAWRRSRRP